MEDILEPTVLQLEEQKLFELELATEARQAFINSMVRQVRHTDGTITYEDKPITELPHGRRVIIDMLGDGETYGVLHAFRKRRVEVTQALNEATGRGQVSVCSLILVERTPEELAFLTLNVLLSTAGKRYAGLTQNALSTRLAHLIRTSMELSDWVRQSREDYKAGKAPDVAKYMLASVNGDVTEKTWRRWKRKLHHLGMEPWTKSEQVQVGAPLLLMAAEAAPDYLERYINYSRGTTYYYRLTEYAVKALADAKEQSVLQQSIMRPMICPPIAWRPV